MHNKKIKNKLIEIANRKVLDEMISDRLYFISHAKPKDVNELWENCFNGETNKTHVKSSISPNGLPITESKQLLGINEIKDVKHWVLKRINEEDIVGYISHGTPSIDEENSFGITIGKKYSNNGLGKEALMTLSEHLKRGGLTEFFGYCYLDNEPSIRLMESCGFTKNDVVLIGGVKTHRLIKIL
jgi:hypothetical protein